MKTTTKKEQKKYEKSLKADMSFKELLTRIVRVKPTNKKAK